MSISSELLRIIDAKADIKAAINAQMGGQVITDGRIDTYAAAVNALRSPATLEVFATTVRISPTQTINVPSNDRIRIYGSDHKSYTVAEWNALWVAAGYDRTQMGVEPIGLRVQCNDIDEIYMFDRYQGRVYNITGEEQHATGALQHSLYNHTLVVATGSGTDNTTGKQWTVTENADGKLVLYEDNTKQSWVMEKDCGDVYAHRAFNPKARTESLWAQTEWMRHRMAITSGVATTAEDGTYGEVQILNASGEQAAVGEDMYFWVKNDNDTLVNTNILAKYNVSNRHAATTAEMTAAIATAIYDKQKAAGINMNDTGVNSASKPILAPGGKGAEVIAVGGYWYIITPFITNSSATTSDAVRNLPDSPAVYWAKSKGFFLPDDSLLVAMWNNKQTLIDTLISYLNSREGRELPVVPTGDYIWAAVRSSANYCWYVNLRIGSPSYVSTSFRYLAVGASASQD